MTARLSTVLGAALVAAAALAGCAGPTDASVTTTRAATTAAEPAPSSAPPAPTVPPPPPPVSGTAADILGQLPVKGRAPKTGYDRDEFPHWISRGGCDTRARILARDAVPGTAVGDGDGCTVGATIDGPYSGREIVEEPGRGSEVDIDHVVALSDAWQTGAQQLTIGQREDLANDPLNLLAVDDTLNRQKGDSNAASWLPPDRGFRCAYVARQVAVKAAYDLWVVPAERDAIARVLAGCPDQPLPNGAGR